MHMNKPLKFMMGFGISVLFIILSVIVIRAFYIGSQQPICLEPDNPERIVQGAPFNRTGLQKVSGKSWDYELVMVASAFNLDPAAVQIPLGAKVKIIAASKDVIHDLSATGTNIDMMLVPGFVKEYITTFQKMGEYRLLCSSYCGSGHKLMISTIRVVK